MKTETATVGTSPEVLQHYLTAEPPIEVQTPHGKAELWGVNKELRATGGWTCDVRHTSPLSEEPTLDELVEALSASQYYSVTECKPILRPFSQLCQPLEDGTVPAIVLTQIIFGDTLTLNGELWAGFDWFGNVVVTENGVRLFSITQYWHCDTANGLESGFEAYDYLRSKHFAVGLQAHQYIAKPAPAPTPIQEGRESQKG